MSTATALPQLTGKMLAWFQHFTNEDNRLTFMNGTQSALACYNTQDSNSARQIGVDNKKKLAPYLDIWTEEEGFSERALKRKLQNLMTAQETKFHKVKGAVDKKDLKPGQRIVCVSKVKELQEVKSEEEGKEATFERVDVPCETLIATDQDNKELQRRTADMAIKMKGLYAADKLELSGLEKLGDRLMRANARIGEEPEPDSKPSTYSTRPSTSADCLDCHEDPAGSCGGQCNIDTGEDISG